MKKNQLNQTFAFLRRRANIVIALSLVFVLFFGIALPLPFSDNLAGLPKDLGIVPSVEANNTYFNFSGGNLRLNITPTTTNIITTNDDWSGVPSVEGYFGKNLTATHGVDPQTILGTEFAANSLPSGTNTQVNANKGNPSAFNAGGVSEFDTGTYLAMGFQGNVQANPYLVFFLNTTGQTSIKMSYVIQDIDEGNNNAVSPVALQYRVGETGTFTNITAAYVVDGTDGPNLVGRITPVNITLPAACDNQPKVQVRLISTNAAATDGTSTPDEWIGINNVIIGNAPPTAASASLGGQVFSPNNLPLSNAMVYLYDNTGNIRAARTNPFGYYLFEEVPVGETYFIEARSKRYVFNEPVQVIFLTEDTKSLNFYSAPVRQDVLSFGKLKTKH